MKIVITVDSTADISSTLKEERNIKILPLHVNLGGEVFFDGEKSSLEIMDYAEKNNVLPKTTSANIFEYVETFKSLKEEYDAIIHIGLSSRISSSFNNAVLAGKEVGGVYCIDSLSLSGGMAVLALYASDLVAKGLGVEEIVEKTNARVKDVVTTFVIERLDYLHKGGRCSSIELLGANILKIRPRIILKDGVMETDKKYRGKMDFVVKKYCEELFEEYSNPDLEYVSINYSSITKEMLDEAVNACKERGFRHIYACFTGGTITSHCGPNTVGVFFINDGGNK